MRWGTSIMMRIFFVFYRRQSIGWFFFLWRVESDFFQLFSEYVWNEKCHKFVAQNKNNSNFICLTKYGKNDMMYINAKSYHFPPRLRSDLDHIPSSNTLVFVSKYEGICKMKHCYSKNFIITLYLEPFKRQKKTILNN